jgi:hypothetical protein
MSISLSIKGYSTTENKQFQKHFNAVKFCIENELSFPKETSEFFKNSIDGCSLEDFSNKYIIQHIQNGLEVPLNINYDPYGYEVKIKVSEIPSDVDLIIVRIN